MLPWAKGFQAARLVLSKPQMACYLPESNRIGLFQSRAMASADRVGEYFSYNVLDTVKFPDDSDQLRYDPATKRVYVGYGDGAHWYGSAAH